MTHSSFKTMNNPIELPSLEEIEMLEKRQSLALESFRYFQRWDNNDS